MIAERVTLDTNILVYAFDCDAGERREVAATLIERAVPLSAAHIGLVVPPVAPLARSTTESVRCVDLGAELLDGTPSVIDLYSASGAWAGIGGVLLTVSISIGEHWTCEALT